MRAKRMSKEEKLAHALKLRDAALRIINQRGKWETISMGGAASGRTMRYICAHLGSLEISYWTPFTPTKSDFSEKQKYLAAHLGLYVPGTLPYRVDIHAHYAGGSDKRYTAMCFEWDDQGNTHLYSLKRSDWEAELMAAADTCKPWPVR